MLNPIVTALFPIKGIWVQYVPTKASFFAWEAAWGKILTFDKLQRRGWPLPNHCYLCGRDEESVHHSRLWDLFFSIVGFSWVFLEIVKDALLS